MKKTLLATLLAIALVVSCFAGMSFTTASAADDYIIFADGAFQNGGEVQAESGTVIKDGALQGGEAMRDGEVDVPGWFQIKIDDSMAAGAFEAYKYLVVDCEPVISKGSTGMYNGGTVQFGQGSSKNFPEIEVNGKVGAKVAKRDTYVLKLEGLTFDANWLLFTHCAVGYKIYTLKLTDDPNGGGDNTPDDPNAGTGYDASKDYGIFINGAFEKGGEVQAESGTVIKDGCLLGGEAMRDGEVDVPGWFQIKIDDTMAAGAFEGYKYLAVDCEPVISKGSTGMYNGGTVQFGQGSSKNFPEIEYSGKVGAKVAKRDIYVLSLDGLTFDANWLLFTHCAVGYKIYNLWLTDDAPRAYNGVNGGGDNPTPTKTTEPKPTPDPTSDTPDPTPAPTSDTPDPTPAPTSDTPDPTPAPTSDTPDPTPAPTTAAPDPTGTTAAPVPTNGTTAAPVPTNGTTAAPAPTSNVQPTTAPSPVNPGTGASGVAGAVAMSVLALAGFAVLSKKSK